MNNIIDHADIINPCSEVFLDTLKQARYANKLINNSYYGYATLGGSSVNYGSSKTIHLSGSIYEEIKLGDFVKLNKSSKENYKDHNFQVIKIGISHDGFYASNGLKLLNLTLKEQTGFDYCIIASTNYVKKDKKTERIYKFKNLINGKQTNIQKQTERKNTNWRQRNLVIPISCG